MIATSVPSMHDHERAGSVRSVAFRLVAGKEAELDRTDRCEASGSSNESMVSTRAQSFPQLAWLSPVELGEHRSISRWGRGGATRTAELS